MVKLNLVHINKINTFKQSILFLILISFITSQIEWIAYDPETQSASFSNKNNPKKKKLAVEFGKSKIPNYIKVIMIPEPKTPTPLLCFSPTFSGCEEERVILVKRTDGNPSFLFVKREEIDNEVSYRELYIYVTCEKDYCGYTINFEGKEFAEIEPNSVFSYIITQYNREMNFKVIGNADEGSFLTIGIEGSNRAQLNIENQERWPTNLDTGKIITFPINNENENSNILASFNISEGNIGEYLTLNIHIVKDRKAPDNLLYPNGPVIMGMLANDEGYFKEECFPISAFESEKFSYINKYYLTGKIYSKYALFWLADENDLYMEETEIEITNGYISYLI